MLSQRLRHRVTFQQRTDVQDEWTLEPSVTWANVSGWVNVPAEVLTGPGREAITGGAKHTEIAARINLRKRDGISTQWRVIWNSNTYDITSIEYDYTGEREMRLICKGSIGDGT